jgi:integrase
MRGHIRERSPGHWSIVLDLRDPITNRRRRKWHSFKGTKRAAQLECARLIAQMQGGGYVEPAKLSLRQYLEKWLASRRPAVAPRTFERYEQLALNNIAPLLGGIMLSKLQPIQISAAYAEAVSKGRRDGKGGLSPRTVHHMHMVLRQALRQAVRWNILTRNPCDLLERKDRPKIERKPVAVLDAEATMQVLEAARGSRWLIPMALGSMCGLRCGEIAALKWDDVRLDQGQIAVKHSVEETRAGVRLKETKGSKCRTVAMPGLLVEELKAWRVRQAQELLRLGIRPDNNTRVVTKADGSCPRPKRITDNVAKFMRRHGSAVRLHGLRHSHASHLLAENIHPKIVQERLGHSGIAITMDIYSHLMPNMQADAAAKLDTALRAAKKPG